MVLRLRTPVKYSSGSQSPLLGFRTVYPTDFSTSLPYTIGTSHYIPKWTHLVNCHPGGGTLVSPMKSTTWSSIQDLFLDHSLCCSGCKCGFTVSGFNPLCLSPLLLCYTGICHLSIGFPHTAGSSYLCPPSPTDQSILFSAVLKQKQYNNKTHVTLLPRASYPIFEHFGWLGDFLCIVNSG